MAANTVIGGDALARGILSQFRDTWRKRYRGLQDRLSKVMHLGLATDKLEELYGYFETAPYPRRRPWGDTVPSEAFRARNYTIENVAWDMSVFWFKHQRQFDQLRDLERAARAAADNFATLPERVFFQMITGTADIDLLEAIPNTPDGAPIYSALDGAGNNRFGVVGGNIIATALGVGSSDAIRDNFFAGVERMASFLDLKGQPLFDPGIIDQGVTVMFDVNLLQVYREAFLQGRTLDGGAAVTNVIMDSGMSVTLEPTIRIAGNAMHLFLDGVEVKPVVEQVFEPLDERVETEDNSDESRRTKKEGVFWETIRGYGANISYGTSRVDP